MTNDYANLTEVFLVLEPPNMELSNEQQLAIQTRADDLRHYEDENLAIICESGPSGTIAIIRKSAIEKVQTSNTERSIRTFVDLLNAFERAGYTIDRKQHGP